MSGLSDIILICATAACAAYCHILAKKLQKISTLESEIGGAIAILSKEVDDLNRATNFAMKSLKLGEAGLETSVRTLQGSMPSKGASLKTHQDELLVKKVYIRNRRKVHDIAKE